jgi:hypothetical protein
MFVWLFLLPIEIRLGKEGPLTSHSNLANVDNMSTITFSKVVSLGSASEDPTPPHPTPAPDFAADDHSLHDTDLMAVSKTLAPIEEDLNEKAYEAMYPSPPVQTPEAFSPAPSVIVRQYRRSRGLSHLPERLAQVQLESSMDDTASSSHSAALSQDDDGNTGSGSITIGLGSPTVNPRLAEYLAHPPPRSAPIPLVGTGQVSIKNNKDRGLQNTDSNPKQESENREGVREASTWSDVALSDLVEALERLEQVVADLEEVDGYPAVERYMACVNMCLKSSDRKYPTTAVMEEKK